MLGHRKLDLGDYVGIVKRRRWHLLVPLLVLPLLMVAVTFLIPPQYLSQTLVLIDQQQVPDEYVKPVVAENLDTRLASMREQISSRSRLQPIIERYNLYGNSHLPMGERVDLARKNISVKAIKSDITNRGGLPGFFISFTANDAHTAQLVCGEITSLFVNENLRSREASAEGTTDFLKSQLEDAKRSLDEQDAKLATFQRQYVGKLPGEEMPNVNMLTSLNTQLEAATQALGRMEQDKSYIQSMQAQISPGSIGSAIPLGPTTVSNPLKETRQAELRTMEKEQGDLETAYTPDHPDVVSIHRKIAEMRKLVAATPDTVSAASVGSSGATAANKTDALAGQQLRAQLHSAEVGIESKRREQAQLQSQVRLYQDRISSSPLVQQEFKQLTRDYETAKKFYEDLLTKMNHSKMATDLERRQQGEQFHVMDRPNLPETPIFPKRIYFFSGGIFLGLLVGVATTAFLEYRNTSLRTPQDVWTFTQLPTLATIGMHYDDNDPKHPKRRHRPGRKRLVEEEQTPDRAAEHV